MNLSEEGLRTALKLLAEPVDAHIDVETLTNAGDRLRRRRKLRWGAAGFAAVAVAAALVAVLPAAIDRTVPAVPEPAATTPVAQAVSAKATIRFDQYGDVSYDQVEVAIEASGAGRTVDVTASSDSISVPLSTSHTAIPEGFWLAEVAEDLVVALIPGQTDAVMTVGENEESFGGGWQAVGVDYLPEAGVTAVAVQRDQSDARFGGLLWLGADETVRNSLGRTVPSTELLYSVRDANGSGGSGRSILVLYDESLDAWGYNDFYNDVWQTLPLETAPLDALYDISAVVEGDSWFERTAVGLLPRGGHDPEVALAQPGARWTAAPLGDSGLIGFVVAADETGKDEPLVESVTYTTSEGDRTTYRP